VEPLRESVASMETLLREWFEGLGGSPSVRSWKSGSGPAGGIPPPSPSDSTSGAYALKSKRITVRNQSQEEVLAWLAIQGIVIQRKTLQRRIIAEHRLATRDWPSGVLSFIGI
jgi:hypothetical protein